MFMEVIEYFFTVKVVLVFIIVNVLVLLYNLQIVINCLKSEASGKTKYILVTGCDSGFGYKTARELNASKVYVFATCLTESSVQKFNDDPSFRGKALVMDVTKNDQIDEAYKVIDEKVGEDGLSCVVSNAGILQPGIIDWQSIADMQQCMNVNLWGAVAVIKKMMPLVKKAKGRFVIVTSMAGRVWFGCHTAYSMSKYALEVFSDGLRHEMKQWHVSVHIIEPGIFLTPIVSTHGIQNQWKDLWNQQSDETKESYGEPFLHQVIGNVKEMVTKLGSPNIKKVTNAICHASLSSNPKKRYVVGFDAWTIWMAIATFPTFISDFIIQSASKSPIPAVVKKVKKSEVDIFT